MEPIDCYDHLCMSWSVVVFCTDGVSGFAYFWLLVVYLCVIPL